MFRNRVLIFGIAAAVLPVTAIMLPTNTVHAQQADEQEAGDVVQEVVVEAPVLQRKVTARGPNGYTTEVVQLKRHVSYADLDLSKESDVRVFHERIEMTAREACEALGATFRKGQKDAGDVYRCTKQAIENIEEEFDSLVATAD